MTVEGIGSLHVGWPIDCSYPYFFGSSAVFQLLQKGRYHPGRVTQFLTYWKDQSFKGYRFLYLLYVSQNLNNSFPQTFLDLTLVYLHKSNGLKLINLDCFLEIDTSRYFNFSSLLHNFLPVVNTRRIDHISGVEFHLDGGVRKYQQFTSEIRELPSSQNYFAVEDAETTLRPAFSTFGLNLLSGLLLFNFGLWFCLNFDFLHLWRWLILILVVVISVILPVIPIPVVIVVIPVPIIVVVISVPIVIIPAEIVIPVAIIVVVVIIPISVVSALIALISVVESPIAPVVGLPIVSSLLVLPLLPVLPAPVVVVVIVVSVIVVAVIIVVVVVIVVVVSASVVASVAPVVVASRLVLLELPFLPEVGLVVLTSP